MSQSALMENGFTNMLDLDAELTIVEQEKSVGLFFAA